MTDPIAFDYRYRIDHIHLVGAGGTGSFLARSIAMILYHMRALNMDVPAFTIQDHDLVQPSNIGRQAFTIQDLDQPKAQVLATRLNLAFGHEIHAVNEPYEHARYYQGPSSVLCGAVDNHMARRELARSQSPLIDCGNSFNAGQVIIGTRHSREIIIQMLNAYDSSRSSSLPDFPNFAAVHPELLEPEPSPVIDPTLSCAELVAANQQHVLINQHIAAIAANYLYRLLFRQPIESFATYLDLETNHAKSVPSTRENLYRYLGAEPPQQPRTKKGRRKQT